MTLAATLGALALSPEPALVWHGSDGERIELSGRVFTTWVAKTSHLLADELDAGPGTLVRIDLGRDHLHWRALILATAAWALAAEPTLPGDAATAGGLTIAVTTGAEPADADDVLAVALPGLALRLPEVPTHAIDYVATVRAYPDAYPFPQGLPVDDRLGAAIDSPSSPLIPPGGLVRAADALFALGVLATGGRVGLTDITDTTRLEALAAQEGLSVGAR